MVSERTRKASLARVIDATQPLQLAKTCAHNPIHLKRRSQGEEKAQRE